MLILVVLFISILTGCASFSIEPDDGRNLTPPTFRFKPYIPIPLNPVEKSSSSYMFK